MGCPWDARGTVSNPTFIKKTNNVYLPHKTPQASGKKSKKIDTVTLLKTSGHQPYLRPDHIAMLVGLPGGYPLRRYDVQPVWLPRRAESPRVRQLMVFLVHRLPRDDRIFVRARSRVRVWRQKLPDRVCGHGGLSWGGAWWKIIWPIPSRAAINDSSPCPAPPWRRSPPWPYLSARSRPPEPHPFSAAQCSPRRPTPQHIAVLRARDISAQLPASTQRNLRLR